MFNRLLHALALRANAKHGRDSFSERPLAPDLRKRDIYEALAAPDKARHDTKALRQLVFQTRFRSACYPPTNRFTLLWESTHVMQVKSFLFVIVGLLLLLPYFPVAIFWLEHSYCLIGYWTLESTLIVLFVLLCDCCDFGTV